MVCVYTVTHTATGMFYIGCTNDLHVRKIKHYGDMRRGVHDNQWMQYNYNFDQEFSWSSVDVPDKASGLVLEKELIANNVTNPLLMNTQGKPVSSEYRQKLIESWTDDRRKILSARRKGRVASQETRDKMSSSHLKRTGGHKKTDEEKLPKPRGVRPSFPISVNGVRYSNVAEASEKMNVLASTVYYRLHNPNKKWVNWIILPS